MKYYVARFREFNKKTGEITYASADIQLFMNYDKALELFTECVGDYLKKRDDEHEGHLYMVEVTEENQIINRTIVDVRM